MAYTREQIKANWIRLRQLIEKAGINVNEAERTSKNEQITRLQAVLRGFFVEVIQAQGNVIETGDEVFRDGSHAELMNFTHGATFNGRYYPDKQTFLNSQCKPGDWAEDAFLSAGFAALGIQPIYHYHGRLRVDPNGEAPFAIQEAVLIAGLQNHSNGHWTFANRQNAGGGDCGLYSAAQAVTSIWTTILKWLNGGAAPFIPTAPALQNIKTRARKDREEQRAYHEVVAQYRDHSFKELLDVYMNLVIVADKSDNYLQEAILISRPEYINGIATGLPAAIQRDLISLFVLSDDGTTIKSLDKTALEQMPAQKQAELFPHLINIIAHYLKRDFAVASAPSTGNRGSTNAVNSLITQRAPVISTPIAPDAAQLRFNNAVNLLKSHQFDLEPLQAIYEDASRLFKFTHNPANNTQAKIIQALANECKNNPAFFERLDFFLTPVKPKAAL